MKLLSWLGKLVLIQEKTARVIDAETGDGVAAQLDQAAENVSPKSRGDTFLAQGKLEEAAASYRQAIAINPRDADAHLNLGFVLSEQKHYEAADRSLRRSLEINPGQADAFYILGLMAKAQGNSTVAIENFIQALERKPDFKIIYGEVCQLLCQDGQVERAIAILVKAIDLYPESADFQTFLGNLYAVEKDTDQAIKCFQMALKIQPEHVAAHNSLGVAFQTQEKFDAAADSYQKAVLLQPGHAEAQGNLGTVFHAQGRVDEAICIYRNVLLSNPNYVEVHLNLGLSLQEQGKSDEAIEHYQRALLLRQNSAEAYFGLGYALREQGHLLAAVESYQKAVFFRLDYAAAWSNLGGVLQVIGNLDAAIDSYKQALVFNPDLCPAHSNLLYAFCFDSRCSPARYLAESVDFGSKLMKSARPYSAWPNILSPSRCLRIGFVSGDLRQHPVGNFLEAVVAMLSVHARDRLELFAYSSCSLDDEVSERIKAHCHGWRSVMRLSDEVLARRIRDDCIDILIDLSGHTEHNRLPMFAWKPAPVQATWLGYLATTGVSAIDYVIADAWTLPESEEVNFTEKVWRLPESYLCFTPPADSVDVGPLPAIHNGYITFGSFNNLTKMNDSVVALWSRILATIPDSRLYLKSPQLKEDSVQQSVVERFAAHGIDAGRLILEGPVPRADYLKPFQRVDIALDPFPYPGITTSVENLWMGVPVLTLAGKSFLSRQGVGLLMNAGLPEWIARDPEDYVARVVLHASDLQRLASLRSGLRQQVLASPIFDAPRFARHFESALRGMWQKWCDQQM